MFEIPSDLQLLRGIKFDDIENLLKESTCFSPKKI